MPLGRLLFSANVSDVNVGEVMIKQGQQRQQRASWTICTALNKITTIFAVSSLKRGVGYREDLWKPFGGVDTLARNKRFELTIYGILRTIRNF